MKLLLGDCLDKLKELDDNSVDAVVTDPPYEIGFMGKGWDDSGIANNPELWKEVLRVLKPGGHLLSFSHSRTYHRQAVAVEDAGFEIRDQIMWIYGSGFPKSHNIGKAVDALEKTGKSNPKALREARMGNDYKPTGQIDYKKGRMFSSDIENDTTQQIINNEWEGWGTALKPAHEPIVMARKPFKGTVADNVLEWGTGGINVDGCRIGTEKVSTHSNGKGNTGDKGIYGTYANQQGSEDREGRFPANIIFDEEAGKLLDEQSGITSQGHWPKGKTKGFGEFGGGESSYEGVGPKDKEKGGASRFFYCPKANKSDRNEGMPEQVPQFTGRPRREDGSVIYKETHPEEWAKAMEGKPRSEKTSLAAAEEIIQERKIVGRDAGQDSRSVPHKARPIGRMNIHPTVKPTDLMAYLVRLVTPKGGIVLDPFMGSGSTGKAAVREGMDFIGIEREGEYMEIAKQRIGWELDKKQIEESKSKFW